ncbi:MAG: hypothetical protein Q7K57_02275 [Burkholderiaceae bacterium]|nr:hypothetical protein [Burkholderiaceae bacterium]
MKRSHPAQRGFAAIAAIFLLVVLAALGGFMLTFSNTQQLTSAQDVQGSRAYWAARAGLEWAVGSLVASSAACPTPPVPFAVDGFTVTVSCARQTYSEGSGTVAVFQLGATATSGGSVGAVGYIERSLSVTVDF